VGLQALEHSWGPVEAGIGAVSLEQQPSLFEGYSAFAFRLLCQQQRHEVRHAHPFLPRFIGVNLFCDDSILRRTAWTNIGQLPYLRHRCVAVEAKAP